MLFILSLVLDRLQDGPRGSKRPPRGLRKPPGAPQEAPRGLQERSRRFKTRPRTPKSPSKMPTRLSETPGPVAVFGKLKKITSWLQKALKTLKVAEIEKTT